MKTPDSEAPVKPGIASTPPNPPEAESGGGPNETLADRIAEARADRAREAVTAARPANHEPLGLD